MRRTLVALSASAVLLLLAVFAGAQVGQRQQNQDLWISINKPAARKAAIAVPELLAPGTMRSSVSDPFTATLRSDLEYSGAFVIADPAHYPAGFRDPTAQDAADRWRAGGAEVLVDTRAEVSGDRVSIEARIWDLAARKMILGRRYSGGVSYVERIAHTVANDIVKYFTGKTGLFLTTIAFVSDRAGSKDVYAMDFDGRSVRQLTSVRSLAINPAAGRSGKIVYTSYAKLFPQIWIMNSDGSGKREVPTGIELNASPSLSPDETQIAFAGSSKGNTDIYSVNAAGGGLRRLTTTRAIEASPAWSPAGRQILYTSDQSGTPQIYVVDPEGSGARRVTFAGNWNDEAAWSPDGARIVFACRNEGDFNICLMDFATGQTVQLTAEGSNGHPTWSPDGEKIVYSSRRGGRTHIYTMDLNGQNKRQLTDSGNNLQPAWLP
ncbi:MAG TPA: Tol-Pal system beta propeller repeat protein TolB [Thermoanaerobaculia bacterium]|jgi:TolB protein